jgi:hypothetical protein
MFVNEKLVKYVVIYGNSQEKKLEVCTGKALYRGVNLYNEPIDTSADYVAFENIAYKQARQVNKAKRNKEVFYTLEKVSAYLDITTLYIPESEIASIVYREESEEIKKGDKTFRDVNTIEFKNIKVKTRKLEAEFKKPTDEYIRGYYHLEEIEKILNRQGNKANKEYLKNKIDQGFEYVIYKWSETESNKIEIKSYVTRHEKTQERLEFEAINRELERINNNWSEYYTEELLKRFKLTRI